MKLNPDCIRDVLRTVEENTDGISPFEYNKDEGFYQHLTSYDHSEILYHIIQCDLADLITGCQILDMGDAILVSDISPKGHDFLANIRKDTIWNKTKEIAGKVGSSSLSALVQIATDVVTELIKSHFRF